ncbi:hypothetical protein BKA64DRAFT_7116 [Cadophora sp. MPI-SDFR-AT-0126]|nr:hypothetical protein BKA64DRAFT_7116 [Leotiomycetes sp. MPI-SDFR-AT-0126]
MSLPLLQISGYSLFEIRTGRKLLDAFDNDDNEYLVKFVEVLGKLPEPWWSSTWEDRKRLFKDEYSDERGRLVAILEPEREPEVGITVITRPWVAYNAKSWKEKIAPGVWYINGPPCADGDRHREISETEQEVFADLLRRLLEYKPERLSAGDGMGHGWFRL